VAGGRFMYRRSSADVAELVDALDLGSSAVRRGGSSPLIRTILVNDYNRLVRAWTAAGSSLSKTVIQIIDDGLRRDLAAEGAK
jgi:hypothetical protein